MPTMNVSLTTDMVDFVEAEVLSGDYVSASEVVRDALRVLRHEKALESHKLRLFRQLIELGNEHALRGEFSDRSIDEIAESVLAGRDHP
jgi:antitoxin ParD1/3/4